MNVPIGDAIAACPLNEHVAMAHLLNLRLLDFEFAMDDGGDLLLQ